MSGLSRKERTKNWFHNNPERGRELRRNYYYRNRDSINTLSKEIRLKDPRKRMFIDSKVTAKEKGYEHNLALEDIVIPACCPVFNKPWDEGQYKPSLDRIDNHQGYVKGNVQVISLLANQMKRDSTKEQLHQFARWVLQ